MKNQCDVTDQNILAMEKLFETLRDRISEVEGKLDEISVTMTAMSISAQSYYGIGPYEIYPINDYRREELSKIIQALNNDLKILGSFDDEFKLRLKKCNADLNHIDRTMNKVKVNLAARLHQCRRLFEERYSKSNTKSVPIDSGEDD